MNPDSKQPPMYYVQPAFNLQKELSGYFKPLAEEESNQIEQQVKFLQIKAEHEKFLREREAKERRLLYAIAEKLGIDTDSI